MQETEMDFESRIVTSDFTPEDNDIENSLRLKVLDDYIGQDKVKEKVLLENPFIFRRQGEEGKHSTMFSNLHSSFRGDFFILFSLHRFIFCMVLPVLAKLLLQVLLQMRWVLIFV